MSLMLEKLTKRKSPLARNAMPSAGNGAELASCTGFGYADAK